MEEEMNKNTAFIMVGASGSGKSTWIHNNATTAKVCSADDYFMGKKGEYNFDPSKLSNAHNACLRKFTRILIYGKTDVVSDNTNTTMAEVAPYVSLAEAYGYDVRVVFMDTPADVCIARNTKEVPAIVIDRMVEQTTALLSSWPRFWGEWEKVSYEYE